MHCIFIYGLVLYCIIYLGININFINFIYQFLKKKKKKKEEDYMYNIIRIRNSAHYR